MPKPNGILKMIFHVGIPIVCARRNFAYAATANNPMMYIKNIDNSTAVVKTDAEMPWAVRDCRAIKIDGDNDKIIVDINIIRQPDTVVAFVIATKERLSSVCVFNFFALNIAPQITDINPMNKNISTGLTKRRMEMYFAKNPYNIVRPSVNTVQNTEKRNGAPINHDVMDLFGVVFMFILPFVFLLVFILSQLAHQTKW